MSQPFLAGPGIPGLVSVIVPAYNRGELIRETIDSALAQTYGNLEVIVVDDGSVDNTRQVMASYSDPRVVYHYKENGGMSSARNAALDRARGEFIAFLDSDDVWHPWKIAAQVEMFRRHPEVGMIWTDMSAITDSGEVTADRYLRTYYGAYRQMRIEQVCAHAGTLGGLSVGAPAEHATSGYYIGNVFREMFLGNLVHPPTAIVTRERLRKAGSFEHEITRGGAEDYHFYLRVTQQGPVGLLDAPSMLYRVHQASITGQNSYREAHADLRVISHWRDTFAAILPTSVIRSRLAVAHSRVGGAELYAGNPRAATPHLWRSLVLNPNQPFIASLLFVSLMPRGTVPRIRAMKNAVRRVARPGLFLRLSVAVTGGLFVVYRLVLAMHPELGE